MHIPENLLKNSLCSICQKYLSVGPIKVYPNRRIKCGRCSSDNDGGTESALYETVAKNFSFPCVNRFDGCKAVLGMVEMKDHERTCKEGNYQCPLCVDFEGTAYQLSLHLKYLHKKDTLRNASFVVDLQKGKQNGTVHFDKNTTLLFMNFIFDDHTQKLQVNVSFTGKNYQGIMTSTFSIYSQHDHKKLIFKSEKIPCTKLGFEAGNYEEIDLSLLEGGEHHLICCNFTVKEEPLLQLQQKSRIFELPHDRGTIFYCRFSDLRDREEETIFYPKPLVVNNFSFDVSIYYSTHEDESEFTLYKRTSGECNVQGEFNLLSSCSTHKQILNPNDIFFDDENDEQIMGTFDIDTDDLFDPENGFVENDSVVIEIRLQVKAVKDESCVYCGSCKHCKK